MTTYSGTRFSGYYLLVQGLAISAWWLWLLTTPQARQYFVPAGAAESELIAFLLPDLAITVGSSLAAGTLFFIGSPWTLPLAWISAGSLLYATLYCLAWAAVRESGWLNVVLMMPAALFVTISALDASASVVPIFRRAAPSGAQRHVIWTAAQIALFWSFFLAVMPWVLVELQSRLGWPAAPPSTAWRTVAGICFVAFSLLGLASGYTMASRGRGTPVPFDGPTTLVVAGPYAFLRNPMVVAGLGQGAMVSLWWGSWAVLGYVILGGVLWQYLVRPAEERDLLATFGESYALYCSQVRCWWPRQPRRTD